MNFNLNVRLEELETFDRISVFYLNLFVPNNNKNKKCRIESDSIELELCFWLKKLRGISYLKALKSYFHIFHWGID